MNKRTMKTRLLALLLTVVMVLGFTTPMAAEAATVAQNSVTIDFTISTQDGVYYHNPSMTVTDFDLTPYYPNNFPANPSDPSSTEMTPQEWFDTISSGVTMVHALTQVNRDTLLDGAEGDVTEWLEFGASGWITKCLGSYDASGYYVNGRYVSTLAPQTVLRNGDQVNFFLYNYMNTNTASFNIAKKSIQTGKEFVLSLTETSYDSNWNQVELPVENAEIVTIDRNSSLAPAVTGTGFVTDKNGEATIKFDQAGVYTVSAVKSGITMPVCTVTVTEPDSFIPSVSENNEQNTDNNNNSNENNNTSDNSGTSEAGNQEENNIKPDNNQTFTVSAAKKAVEKIKLSVAKSVKVGAKKQIKVTLPSSIKKIAKVSYKTSSKKIYVSKKGVVKGKAKGKAKVTVTVKVKVNSKTVSKKFTKTINVK